MTDQAARVVPAGWYADPADATRVRWWNGVSWTDHTEAKPGAAPAHPQAAIEAPVPTGSGIPAANEATEPALTRRAAIAAEDGRTVPDARRSQTGVAWLIALIPVIAFTLSLGAFYLYFYLATTALVILLALVPYLLGLLWAAADSRRLAERGFRPPSPLWALLTPLPYLVVRRVRVPGTGPLVLIIVTASLAMVLPSVLLLTPAARVVTVAIEVQHAAQAQLVDTGRLRSVTCPPIVESLKAGSMFTCQATATDGTPTQAWVSIDSSDGRFSIAPAL